MKELIPTAETPKRAFLVEVVEDKMSSAEPFFAREREFTGLVNTLGLEIVCLEPVNVREKNIRYAMGTGKAEEIAGKAASLEADCLIFDRDLSPSQQRNWEELTGIPAIDRQELIIQIFASRARTREAELQVHLAELTYALPRLRHKYIDLSRQRGGSYGTRGSGETRFETDRRKVQQRIHRLEEELEELKIQRQLQRKQRRRREVPVCAIVGYTNAGKSTIFNALTGAGVLAEDKLFATLDSTSRKLKLPQGLQVLLVDTVGFIRRLPHNLIKAFHSTLEEACDADVLLNVLDASSPDTSTQYSTTLSVLREIGADNIPMITVLNKTDLMEAPINIEGLLKLYPGSVAVSAISGLSDEKHTEDTSGLIELCARIELCLSRGKMRLRLPPDRTDLAALIHREGQVISERYDEKFIEMEARLDEKTAGRLREYRIND
jgi:GTP-binding protein HflX